MCIEKKEVYQLCLGTVQLGMKYGVKNELGRQPTRKESFILLEEAINQGIKSFDTASVYGDAEKILGEFGIGRCGVQLISKLFFSDEEKNSMNIKDIAERKLQNSLKNLRIDALDGCLLHTAADLYNDAIMESMQSLKKQKLVRKIGVSIYEPVDALAAVKSGVVDIIQIPYNVFDQRLDETEFFSLVKEKKVQIFARSAFLQGSLLMQPEELPPHLIKAKQYLIKFQEIAQKYRYSCLEAALLYSYCHSGIEKVVFGVERLEQLQEILLALRKQQGFSSCREALQGAFTAMERSIILPSLWEAR